jgi:hypothetical protein
MASSMTTKDGKPFDRPALEGLMRVSRIHPSIHVAAWWKSC